MEAHEVENLIPISLLKLVVGNKKVAVYEKIQSKEFGDSFLKYFDFKEGFHESSYRNIRKKSIGLFPNYRNLLLQLGKKENYLKAILLKKYNKKNDNEIIGGLGNTVLADTLTYLKTHYISNNNIVVSTYQSKDWDEISKRVWSIGCAVKPQRL